MMHVLLVYSHERQELVSQEVFHDSKMATTAYAEAEEKYRDEGDAYEVVLVGADSIDTIERTHGHYFRLDETTLFSRFLPA